LMTLNGVVRFFPTQIIATQDLTAWHRAQPLGFPAKRAMSAWAPQDDRPKKAVPLPNAQRATARLLVSVDLELKKGSLFPGNPHVCWL
jgi:hypothetical protein